MFKFLRGNSTKEPLAHLDILFNQTISKLPVHEQIAYCQRLIESSQYQLSHQCPKKDSEHLKCLIKAADVEIQKLNTTGIDS